MRTVGLNVTMFFLVLGLLMPCLTLESGSAYAQAGKIVLKKYPELKLGFTTTNFLNLLPVSVDNKKKLIDYAAEQGYVWIELRDPNADLTLANCRELATYANNKGIKIGYAIQKGLLDKDFLETFSRGLANAAVFEGPKTIRVLGASAEFQDPKKKAWTLEELYKAVETANTAANKAKELGLQLVVENAFEPLKGDGISSFGTTEFFANVNRNVALQLDTANLFAVSRVCAAPEDAKKFLEKNIGNLAYIHLKTSTPEHKVSPCLGDNELGFDIVFELMQKNRVYWVAIELPGAKTLEEAKGNHERSVKYLMDKY